MADFNDPLTDGAPISDPFSTNGDPNGEPDTLPMTFCRKCEVEVKPVGKGKCPRCGIFLRQNFVARRHPVNKLRVEQHLAELFAEFRPATVVGRRTCEQLAGIYEQLEGLKPGSTEWQRLVTTAQTLSVALQESSHKPHTSTDYRAMTADQLVERAEKLLATAKALRDHQPPRPNDAEPSTSPLEVFWREAATAPVEALAPAPAARPSELPPPQCPYCHKSLADCAEMRMARPEVFKALHYDSPEMVEKRRQYNTAVMMRQVGRGLPVWYR